MTKEDLYRIFGITDIIRLPEAVMSVLMGDREERNRIYGELLKANDFDLSHDWFQTIYEAEFAERKQKKQDFTPQELSTICARLVDTVGTVHEPTSGNGSMIIAHWWEGCCRCMPWEYFPSQHQVTTWELSDRSIPLLLLNLSIRGMMGYVYHGDVLEGTVKQKYILLNPKDDTLAFSDIIKASAGDKIVRYDAE